MVLQITEATANATTTDNNTTTTPDKKVKWEAGGVFSYKNETGVSLSQLGISAGLDVNGWKPRIELRGSRDSFTSEVRVDKDIPITQNWDVTTGVSCDYTKLKRSCSSHHKPETIYVMEGTTAKPVELPPVSSSKYSGNIFSLGTKVMPTYTTSNGKFTFGAGASAHYVAHDIPATLHCEQGDCSQPVETGVKNNNNFLFSPEVSFRAKLFDDGENCLNLNADANIYGGAIRLSLCF